MTAQPGSSTRALIAVFSLIVLLAAAWVAWEVYSEKLIEAAYNGQSLPLVNKYVAIHRSIDPSNRTLEYFLRNGQPVVPRLLGMFIILLLIIAAGLRTRFAVIRRFFSEATHPANLAIFRIVLFIALLGYVDISQIVEFSRFPVELRVAPPGIGWLLNILPITPDIAVVASYLFIAVCICGLVGFFSRTSAVLAALLGLYVLGIPQFFGKIDHYHHLLWFAAILAASHCGDALSIDAVLAARKTKANVSAGKLREYALPLRFAMLLMGTIYFFAGVWKFVIGGVGWATGDTMRDILYAQWYRLDWVPQLRIDNYPFLYHLAGCGVILFEFAFIFVILFPRLRIYAATAGLLFHVSVYFFAHINFWTLASCYVIFIDFEPLYRWISSKDKVGSPLQSENGTVEWSNGKLRPLTIVGATLLAINIFCGIALIDSWPFAVYPTFAGVEEKYIQSLTVSLLNPDGTRTEIIPYKEHSFQSAIHPSRLIGLFTQVLWARDVREVERRGTALLNVLSGYDVRFRQARSIALYKDVCSVVPEEQKGNPVRRELLLSVER